MNTPDLLDIFKSLPEEEQNKIYLTIEITLLECNNHRLFDSADFVHMDRADYLKLKRMLGDVNILLKRAQPKEVNV